MIVFIVVVFLACYVCNNKHDLFEHGINKMQMIDLDAMLSTERYFQSNEVTRIAH